MKRLKILGIALLLIITVLAANTGLTFGEELVRDNVPDIEWNTEDLETGEDEACEDNLSSDQELFEESLASEECEHRITFAVNESTHAEFCNTCGYLGPSVPHDYGDTGFCSICSRSCSHDYSDSNSKCTYCGLKHGEGYNPHHYEQINCHTKACVACEKTFESYIYAGYGTHNNRYHWMICANCLQNVTGFVPHDYNENGYCRCGKTYECPHADANCDAYCDDCGKKIGCEDLNYDGYCDYCGAEHIHTWVSGRCKECNALCIHVYDESDECSICGMACKHTGGKYQYNPVYHWFSCSNCKLAYAKYGPHEYDEKGVCKVCRKRYECVHIDSDGNGYCEICENFVACKDWDDDEYCNYCGKHISHSWDDDFICTVCGHKCPHNCRDLYGKCEYCGFQCPHTRTSHDGSCPDCFSRNTGIIHEEYIVFNFSNHSVLCRNCDYQKDNIHTLNETGTCTVCGYDSNCRHESLDDNGDCVYCHKNRALFCKHEIVSIKDVEATCTEPGLSGGKQCSKCGLVLLPQKETAPRHREVIDEAIEATCTRGGLTEGKHCADCGAVLEKRKIVPAVDHTVVTDLAVEATTEKPGFTEGSHCSVCNKVIVEQLVIPIKIAIINFAAVNTANGVALSWTPSSKASGFELFRKDEAAGTFKSIARTSSTSYCDKSVQLNGVYTYKVRAYTYDGGKFIYNDFSSTSTTGYIAQVGGLTLTQTLTGIQVTWAKIEGVRGYQIYRRAEGESSFTQVGAVVSTGFTDTSVESSKVYVYMIRGYNKAANGTIYYGAFSPSATKGYLNQVKNLTAAPGTEGMNLTWTTIPGTRGYQIYRKLENENSFTNIGASVSGTFTDTTAENGKTYVYMVRGYNKTAAGSVYYGIFSASVTKLFMAQVKNVTLQKAGTGIRISWTAVSGARGYQIYRKAEGENSYKRVGVAAGKTTSFTDTTATGKTVYTYMVRVYNLADDGTVNTGVFSASVSIK